MMRAKLFATAGLLALLVAWGQPPPSAAQLIPGGGFEAPPVAPAAALPPGWLPPTGNAGVMPWPLVIPAPPRPYIGTEGTQMAAMSTWGAPGTDPAAPPPYATALPFFGGPAAIPAAGLELALSLPVGSLVGAGATEGSGIISMPFVAPAGTVSISFDWMFATNEPFRVPPLPDFAFYSIDGGAPVVLAVPGMTVGPVAANTYFGFDLGPPFVPPPMLTTTVGLAPGVHTIAFGVVDVGDALMNSGLFVDNVRLTAVPEPTTLLLLGLAGFGSGAEFYRRRRAKALAAAAAEAELE